MISSRYLVGISLSLLAFAIAISGCSSKKVNDGGAKINPDQVYAAERERLEKTKEISPGFTLRIRHSADGNLSGEFKVGFNGLLKLPYKINVKAAGLTTDELEEKLEKAYSSYFKSHNKVNVEIASREYAVELRGLISKPAIYSIKLDTSLEELIAMGGGFLGGSGGSESKIAGQKPEYIRIVRPDFMNPAGTPTVHWVKISDYFLKYDVQNEILWRGGEQLFFQMTGDPQGLKKKSAVVQVLGEVHKPGDYAIQPGADLYIYIAQAGGPTSNADLGNVTVIHKENNDSETRDLTKGTRYVDLGSGDIVLVRAVDNKPSTMEKVLPVAVSLTSIVVSVVTLIFIL